MSTPDTIRARLRAMAELAGRESTPEHERAAAQGHLERLLSKYGLTMADVLREEQPRTCYSYTYTEQWERQILMQLAVLIVGDIDELNVYSRRGDKRRKTKTVMFDFTNVEAIEFARLYQEYRKAFLEDFKVFVSAFIQRNDLGYSPKTPRPEKPATPEERARIKQMLEMAEAMRRVNVLRNKDLLPASGETGK